jgi:ankyrin repeat protein
MSLEDGSTATIAASYGGYHEIVDLLVSANEDCMNGRFKNGSTPLMTAALNGHLSVVQVLLKHGVEVNARNEDSWSALAVAAQKGCLQITKLLLAAHAEVDAVTDRGYTPLMLAVKAGHLELTKVLVEHGAQVNHFRFDWLEDKLAPAKIPLLYGYLSPLMLAINTGDVALIEFLLQQEADLSLDLAQIIPHSESPKDKYTQEGHEALKKALRLAEEAEAALKLIVEKGETTQRLRNANNYRDAQTAVEVAGKRLEQFQDEQIQQQQALRDATLVYTHFSTPLLFAVYWDNPEIVRMLMAAASTGQSGSEAAVCDAGAASTSAGGLVPALLAQRNVHDLSAIELAVAYGYPQMVLLLMEYGATLPFDAEAVRLWAKLLYRWQFVAIARISCYAMYQRLFWRKPASPAVLPAASKSKDD